MSLQEFTRWLALEMIEQEARSLAEAKQRSMNIPS